MDILVKIKNVYGNEMIYPVCEKALIFANMAGTKTLTHQSIKQIKALGYTIAVQQKTL